MIFAVLDYDFVALTHGCKLASFYHFIKVWPYTAKFTNVIVTSFGESSNLVSKSKTFVKGFEQSGRCRVKSCVFWQVGF